MIHVILLFMLFVGVGMFATLYFECKACNWQKYLGESFFIGTVIVIVINNTAQLFNYNLNQKYFFDICTLISSFSLLFYIVKKTQSFTLFHVKFKKIETYYIILLLIIIYHLYSIIVQNSLLPLTPWDAWSAWVAKAKIWYAYGINQTITTQSQWLNLDDAMVNKAAHYPDGLSLIYVFNAGFYGWNETVLNAVYPAMFMAFLLAFYGNIVILTNRCYAILSVFILATLPLINVHIILAGYADLWIAAYLILILFNIQNYLSTHRPLNFILVIMFTLALLMLKHEAIVWILFMVITYAISRIRKPLRKYIYFSVIGIVALWYVVGGFHFNFQNETVIISPQLVAIPGLEVINLKFINTSMAWIEALFVSKNWHVLWFSLPVVLYFLSSLKQKPLIRFPGYFLIFSTLFLFIIFNFTAISQFATSFTYINRLILQITPVYIYFATQVIYQYTLQKNDGSNKVLNVNVSNVF